MQTHESVDIFVDLIYKMKTFDRSFCRPQVERGKDVQNLMRDEILKELELEIVLELIFAD